MSWRTLERDHFGFAAMSLGRHDCLLGTVGRRSCRRPDIGGNRGRELSSAQSGASAAGLQSGTAVVRMTSRPDLPAARSPPCCRRGATATTTPCEALLPLVERELRRLAGTLHARRTSRAHAAADGAGQRGVPAAGRRQARALAEPRALPGRVGAHDAPHPRRHGPRQGLPEAGRPGAVVPLDESTWPSPTPDARPRGPARRARRARRARTRARARSSSCASSAA